MEIKLKDEPGFRVYGTPRDEINRLFEMIRDADASFHGVKLKPIIQQIADILDLMDAKMNEGRD